MISNNLYYYATQSYSREHTDFEESLASSWGRWRGPSLTGFGKLAASSIRLPEENLSITVSKRESRYLAHHLVFNDSLLQSLAAERCQAQFECTIDELLLVASKHQGTFLRWCQLKSRYQPPASSTLPKRRLDPGFAVECGEDP